jgi:hypothetical protein
MDADRLRGDAVQPGDTAIQTRMEALVRRLDKALDSDGQLP